MKNWQDFNINTRGRTNGEVKTECPQCQSTRQKHRKDLPLSVNLDKGIWRCHHCKWSGTLDQETRKFTPRRTYTKPAYTPKPAAQETLTWFKSRGISESVVRRHHIEARDTFMPQLGRETRVIAFPYFRNGEVVNVKYRSNEKHFKMEKDAELILYGIDDLKPDVPAIFVEGEFDKLALEVAGFLNCVSLPNGTGTNLDVLANAEEKLELCKRIIWAGDNDEPGRKLEREAIRRLGPERCWRVEWPEDCKDANDVLMRFGVEAVQNCIEGARPVPIEGIFEVVDILPDLMQIYEIGRPQGHLTGWENLNKLYRPRPGKNTIITGVPQSGKSAFLRALLVNLAWQYDWKFAVFPPEDMPPEEYFSQLAELYVGLPFDEGRTQRMSLYQLQDASSWIQEHFVLLNPSEDDRSPDKLFKLFSSCVLRRGVHGIAIDPFNELEHQHGSNQTEAQYLNSFLMKFNSFVHRHNIHGWICAHPRIMQKGADGQYEVVSPYHINGGAAWYNKADFLLSIWRNMEDREAAVDVYAQKVKQRWCGRTGKASLYFDLVTGRYSQTKGLYALPPKLITENAEEWTV
jgi:twinkle protein